MPGDKDLLRVLLRNRYYRLQEGADDRVSQLLLLLRVKQTLTSTSGRDSCRQQRMHAHGPGHFYTSGCSRLLRGNGLGFHVMDPFCLPPLPERLLQGWREAAVFVFQKLRRDFPCPHLPCPSIDLEARLERPLRHDIAGI